MHNYKLQLLDFGPFDIPAKKAWLIVGSGPSFDDAYLDELDPSIGVIALNGLLKKVPRADIAMISHYEIFWELMLHLKKADYAYIANPLHVGFRCIPCNALDLFDLDALVKHPKPEIRFFEKELSLTASVARSHTLFAKETIASAALQLLDINGIKSVFTTGIDGGHGHAKRLADMPAYNDELNCLQGELSVDLCFEEFHNTAKTLGIAVHPLHQKKENYQCSASN